jgi:hypothetical protein
MSVSEFLISYFRILIKYLKINLLGDKMATINELEQEWASKYPEKRIIYNAQYNRPRDVRTFLFDKSYILEDAVNKYKLRGSNDSDTMYKILMFVIGHFQYVGDKKTKKQAEFWQNPEDSITAGRGDCEDGAILIKSLSLVAGVPDWRVRVVAGSVKGGGHAYATYIRDDGKQVILDWCYWPNKLLVDARKPIEQENNYYDVWFSFTREHTYGPRDLHYGPN